jgi:putative membrane protein
MTSILRRITALTTTVLALNFNPAQIALADDAATTGYVQLAAIGDMFEIQSSELALSRAVSPEIKQFAKMMTADHTSTTEKLKAALAESNVDVPLPNDLDAKHAALLADLKSADENEFDALYVKMQLDAHKQALALHKGYSESGEVPALKAVATGAIGVIEHHLASAEALQ